jgi:hypothetical protein
MRSREIEQSFVLCGIPLYTFSQIQKPNQPVRPEFACSCSTPISSQPLSVLTRHGALSGARL